MSWFTLVLLALATQQTIDLWLRSRLTGYVRRRLKRLPGLAGYLFGCPICLSVWVATIFVILFCFLPTAAQTIAGVLAISKLASIFNDLMYNWDRNEGWSCAQQIEQESVNQHGSETEYV